MGRVAASPSPSKHTRSTHASRPTSPTKPHPTTTTTNPKQTRPPSTSTFNPHLPKTPGFPSHTNTNAYAHNNGVIPPTTARIPGRHENMLSTNGSPLANPYELGLGWFAEGGGDSDGDGDGEDQGGTGAAAGEGERRKREKSIVVRRDPYFS